MPRKKALALLYVMVDETWAMAVSDAKKHNRTRLNVPYDLGVTLILCSTWAVFTTLGVYFGPMIGDLKAYGWIWRLQRCFWCC